MDPTLARKLEKLKNISTRYEIIAKRDNEKILVMYGRKSKRGIIAGLSDNNYKRLLALARVTNTEPESWKVDTGEGKNNYILGITSGNWAIVPSGRTQREAYIEGELSSIYND